MRQRRRFDETFKAKVALEALKEEKTLQELAEEYEVHPGALWRSLKSEDIYLKSYESVRELKRGLGRYFRFCNERRYHQNLEYQKPDEMYESFQIEKDPVAA